LLQSDNFSSLTDEEKDQIKQQKRLAMNFINGLINLLNSELGETTVNVNSSTNEKIRFITKLSKDLDQGFSED
jgi:hypothetical protein